MYDYFYTFKRTKNTDIYLYQNRNLNSVILRTRTQTDNQFIFGTETKNIIPSQPSPGFNWVGLGFLDFPRKLVEMPDIENLDRSHISIV